MPKQNKDEIDTSYTCAACHGSIMAEIQRTNPRFLLPDDGRIGPRDEEIEDVPDVITIGCFFCASCGLMYKFPRHGRKAGEEILAKLRKEEGQVGRHSSD